VRGPLRIIIHRRLKRLEDASRHSSRTVSAKALKALSDEVLDALEETFETALASGEDSFEDFYAVVKERGRRALHADYEAIEAWWRLRGAQAAFQHVFGSGTVGRVVTDDDAL
jgi:hypothetical protein